VFFRSPLAGFFLTRLAGPAVPGPARIAITRRIHLAILIEFGVMRLREIMRKSVVTIDSEEAANLARSRMRRRRIRHLVVTENGHLVGVLSERDLGGRSGADIQKGRTVRELMTPRVVTAKPKTTLRQAANLMRGRLIGSLPVLEGDRLVGIVTATDVLDELGRGSARPAIRAKRPTLRLPANSKRRGGRPVVRRPPRSRRTGRERPRRSGSKKRAPFPATLPRSSKRESGATRPPLVPAYIRVLGVELGPDDRTYIRRKLGTKLGRYATSIERVSVRVEDVNGPRGGVDQVCRIKVVLRGLPSVVFEGRDASLDAAIDRALTGAERGVRRSLQRRRMRPIREAGRRRPVSAA
jgi:CBS domain-containing protein